MGCTKDENGPSGIHPMSFFFLKSRL
jgi:hypothetical protein